MAVIGTWLWTSFTTGERPCTAEPLPMPLLVPQDAGSINQTEETGLRNVQSTSSAPTQKDALFIDKNEALVSYSKLFK